MENTENTNIENTDIKGTVQKPVELTMEELTNYIVSECNKSGLSLYFLDTVLRNIYSMVHEKYTNELRNRLNEYTDSLKKEQKVKNKTSD